MVPAFLYSLYLTLYTTDTSLRRTLSAGPKSVRLRESWLYVSEITAVDTGQLTGGKDWQWLKLEKKMRQVFQVLILIAYRNHQKSIMVKYYC